MQFPGLLQVHKAVSVHESPSRLSPPAPAIWSADDVVRGSGQPAGGCCSCSTACGWAGLGPVVFPPPEPPGPSSSGTARGPPAATGRGPGTNAPDPPSCPTVLDGAPDGVPRVSGWSPQMANLTEMTWWQRRSFFLPGFRHQSDAVHRTGRRKREPANISKDFNKTNKHKSKLTAPHGRLPHTK